MVAIVAFLFDCNRRGDMVMGGVACFSLPNEVIRFELIQPNEPIASWFRGKIADVLLGREDDLLASR